MGCNLISSVRMYRWMNRSSTTAVLLALWFAPVVWAQPEPQEIQEWYEQGNLYLEQGLYATAQKEFRKVVRAIPPQQRPATLQLLARSYYLQGNLEAAIVSLKRAALLAPRSNATRQLLLTTMENADRRDEATAWLDRLNREGAGVLAKELGADLPADELELHRFGATQPEPELAAPHERGAFRARFSERSPLSSIEIYQDRYEMSRVSILASDPAGGDYDLAAESFEVFVPETYDPEQPFGLLVWISPASSGGLSRPDNLELLAEKRLIWVGANNSGNDRWHWYRTGLALDAAHNMQRLYNIDPGRIYISGYSGGGRVASSLGFLFPEVFRGGAYFFGCNYIRNVAVPGKPGAYWRAGFPAPPNGDLRRIKKEHRFVLVTGERDFNRDETEAYFGEYKRDRFKHVTYIEIPEADHGYGVRGKWLAKVVEALDEAIEGD